MQKNKMKNFSISKMLWGGGKSIKHKLCVGDINSGLVKLWAMKGAQKYPLICAAPPSKNILQPPTKT